MGTIGVRCANRRTSLWFHLCVAFATDFLHPAFRTDDREYEYNALLQQHPPWQELTPVGRTMARLILELPGVVALRARPHYFDLEVADEASWRTVLPGVIRIIREETNDPDARVVNKLGRHPCEQWHLPLLEEFFGPGPA